MRINSNSKDLKKRARKIESTTLRHAHRFLVRRWENAREVRRHIVGWLALVALLIGATLLQGVWYLSSHTTQAPSVVQTTYAEGVLDKFDTINPLFATTHSERSASRLVFASLLSYDRSNHLQGDLAETWSTSNDGETYTITLKPNLRWQDGEPVTADDVIYTIKLMKDPIVRANPALFQTWTQVDARKIDARTIEFMLPGKFPPFLHALTFGVVPKHALEKVKPERLRENDFGRKPVGNGPFKVQNIQVIDPSKDRLVIQFAANQDYHGGSPRLSRFQLHTYGKQEQLQQGYLSGEINAAVGLPAANLTAISDARPNAKISRVGIHDGMFTMFNTVSPVLADLDVRKALTHATDRSAVIDALGGNALPMEGPLLGSQHSGDGKVRQLKHDKRAAEQLLDNAGWRMGDDGIRYKGRQALRLNLVAPRSGDYEMIVEQVSRGWREIGVDVRTEMMSAETFVQNVLRPRSYDVLIYELAIGVDPDVYAYWHSSQAGPDGRNLASYESDIADEALQSARASSQPQLRAAKYGAFVEQWLKDVPAIALYQPTLHYVSTETTISVPESGNVADSVDRYRAVKYWTVGSDLVFTTP